MPLSFRIALTYCDHAVGEGASSISWSLGCRQAVPGHAMCVHEHRHPPRDGDESYPGHGDVEILLGDLGT